MTSDRAIMRDEIRRPHEAPSRVPVTEFTTPFEGLSDPFTATKEQVPCLDGAIAPPMRALAAIGICSLLLVPGASAGTTAALTTEDPIRFPEGTSYDLTAMGAFGDTTTIQALTIEASRAEVRELTLHVMTTPILRVDAVAMQDERSFVLRDLRIALLSGDPRGWAAWEGEGLASSSSDPDLVARPEDDAQLGSADVSAGPSNALGPSYARALPGASIRLDASGDVILAGAARVVLFGPDVEIASRENTTRVETGMRWMNATAQHRIETYLEVRLPRDATLRLANDAPIQLAGPRATVRFDGALALNAQTGEVVTESASFRLDRAGPAVLDGAWTARIEALDGGVAAITATGELRATTLRREPALASTGAPWWMIAAAGAVLVVAVAIALQGRRRGGLLTAEDCVALADAAVEDDDHALALSWYARARELAPGSRRVRLAEAYCLGAVGRVEDAIAAYDAVGGPDAAFESARLLLASGRDAALAERRLVRALEDAPILVADVDGRAFAPLAGRPAFEDARRRALARMNE